jgi:hypothetical protein
LNKNKALCGNNFTPATLETNKIELRYRKVLYQHFQE